MIFRILKLNAFIIVLLMLASTSLQLINESYGTDMESIERPLINSGAIKIENDSEMDAAAIINGWPGQGTSSDPYIIDNLTIDAKGGYSALFLKEVTRHSVFINCTFFNATKLNNYPYGSAVNVHIERSENITIKESTVHSSYNGIYVDKSDDISILNVIGRNSSGIGLSETKNSVIDGCDLSDRSSIGVTSATINCRVTNNTIVDTQIGLGTVSGTFLIENNTFRNCEWGIIVYSAYFWSPIIIRNNHITETRVGIRSIKPNNIVGNYIESTEYGIEAGRDYAIYYSITDMKIHDNEIISDEVGIKIFWMGASIIGNDITSDLFGLEIMQGTTEVGRGYSYDIYRNDLFRGGIKLKNIDLEMNISTNNTLNGYPIYFYNQTDLEGFNFPSNAGQILIDRCDNVIVSGLKNLGAVFVYKSNGTIIKDSMIKTSGVALRSDYSYNMNFSGNTIIDSGIGVSIFVGNGTIIDNYIDSSIYAFECNSGVNNIFSNKMWNGSIKTRYSLYQNYDDNNTINGKKLLYLKDMNMLGQKIPEDIGLLIARNVDHLDIRNLSISNSSNMIALLECEYVSVQNCSAFNIMEYGMFFSDCYQIDIKDCHLENCEYGIDILYPSTYATVEDCWFINNSYAGLELGGVRYCDVFNSFFIRNRYGIIDNTHTPDDGMFINIFDNLFLHQESFAMSVYNDEICFNNSFIENNLVKDYFGEYDGQVVHDGEPNWFNEEMEIGNYWSDYSGTDSNNDGIFDLLFRVNQIRGGIDEYPLAYCPHVSAPELNLRGYQGDIIVELNHSSSSDIFVHLGQKIFRSVNGSGYDILYEGPETSNQVADTNTTPAMLHSYFSRRWVTINGTNWRGVGQSSTILSEFSDPFGPIINITSPDQNVFLDYNNVNVTWTILENITQIQSIEISSDGGEFEDTGSIYSTYTLLSNLYEGPHSFSVRATDTAQNTEMASFNFTVDTSVPLMEIIKPVDSQWFNYSYIEISWNSSDNITSIDSSILRINYDILILVDPYGERYIEFEEGLHQVTLKFEDQAGNSISRSVDFGVDMTEPWIKPITMIPVMNSTAIRIEWTAKDNLSGIDEMLIELDDITYNVSGYFNWTTPELTIGHHTGQLLVKDTAGNLARMELHIPFIDPNPPELTIQFPLDGGYYNETDLVVLWEAFDAESGIEMTEICIDSGSWTPVESSSFKLTGLVDGEHNVELRVIDHNNNIIHRNISFFIDTVSPFIVSFTPQESIVAANSTLIIEFSELINNLNISIEPDIDYEVSRLDDNFTVLTISTQWAYDQQYLIEFTGMDHVGNRLVNSIIELSIIDMAWINGKIKIEGDLEMATLELEFDGTSMISIDDNGTFEVITVSGFHEIEIRSGLTVLYQSNFNLTPGQNLDLGEITVSPPEISKQKPEENPPYVLIAISLATVVIIVALLLFIILRKKKIDDESINQYETTSNEKEVSSEGGSTGEDDPLGDIFSSSVENKEIFPQTESQFEHDNIEQDMSVEAPIEMIEKQELDIAMKDLLMDSDFDTENREEEHSLEPGINS